MKFIHVVRLAGLRMLRLVSNPAELPLAERIRLADRDTAAGITIAKYIRSRGAHADGLDVQYQPATGTLFIYGTVADLHSRDRILGCCADVARVARVVDRMRLGRTDTPLSDPGLPAPVTS